VLKIPWVFHRAVVARLVGRAHGEFVHVGLAQRDGASSGQFRDHGGVVRRFEVVEHLRGAAGADTLGAEQILVGQWGTQQGIVLTGSATGVSSLRLGDRQVLGQGDEAVELRVELRDALEQDTGQFFGRKLFIGESASDLGQSHLMH